MENIKTYRGNELKKYVIANINVDPMSRTINKKVLKFE